MIDPSDMTSQIPLQNSISGQNTGNEESNFAPFPRLTKELRLEVWRHALQRQRIINVLLEVQTGQTTTQTAEIAGSASKSERYCAIVDGYQLLSKFLRVNSESREAALKFYRVHLPCKFVGAVDGKGTTSPGILYFNPEHDFLHITPRMPVKDTLVDFLYHLKTTHDPRHVGLLNLAVDLNDLNANDLYKLQSPDLDDEVRNAFFETLTQLREVFFISTPRVGRQIFGLMSGASTSETIFNRSFPIMATTPTFERLHRDPRPIAQDLRKVFTGTADSRHMLDLWLQLLDKWHVSPPHIEYRFLLAFDPTLQGGPIRDRKSAQNLLQQEDDAWKKRSKRGPVKISREQDGQAKTDGSMPGSSEKEKKEAEEDQNWPIRASPEECQHEGPEKTIRSAFGFWLFPVGALGPLQEEGLPSGQKFQHRAKRMLDMTGHWPELALSSLP